MVDTVQSRPSSGSAEVAMKKKYSEACQNVSLNIKWPETLGLFLKKTERAEGEKFIIKTQGQERIHVLYHQSH